MSILRQFSTRHLLIASLICTPLLLDAQNTTRTNKKAHNTKQRTSSTAITGTIDYKAIGAPMPPLRVVYPNKAVYTSESLNNDANLFMMLFNPTCEHCEDMAFALKKNIELFSKSHILLVAGPAMGPYLEFFENGTKVQDFPKIKMGLDSSGIINHTFTYESLPQINVYSPDRKLLRTFNGITTVDSLKPYIQ